MMNQMRQIIKNNNKHITNKFNIIRTMHLGGTSNTTSNTTNITKKCIDCKHYVLNIAVNNDNTKFYDYANAKCLKFKTKNAVTNEIEYANAYISRSERILCGSSGKHFAKKDKM